MSSSDFTLLRTSDLILTELVANLLTENNIPFYRRSEQGGVELAMPAAAAPFPGAYWLIKVPLNFKSEAEAILNSIPSAADAGNSGPTDFVSSPGRKTSLRLYAQITLFVIFLHFLLSVFQMR